MAKTTVADWDTTAADNTDVGGISLAENVMKPPAVNDALREMMAQIATYFGNTELKWRLRAIGEIVYVDTSLTGVEIPPADAGFIELTAGLDGSGQYNEGKLTGETIGGTGATLTAIAVIDDADSPMNGQTISLINTEERVQYAGERAKSGGVFNDQIEDHAHVQQVSGTGTKGTVSGTSTLFLYIAADGETGPANVSVGSGTPRAGDRTRAKGQFVVAFLKYKDVA